MAAYIRRMRFTRRQILRAAGAGATLALSASGSSVFAQIPPFKGSLGAFAPRTPPEAAPAIAFKSADGKELTLADFKGRALVLNYWATWCAPCVEEMPALDKLHAAMVGEGIEVAAISVDRGGLRQVAPFFEINALKNLPVYLDPPGASMRAFGIRGLPTTIVIDREGRDAGRLEGMAHWDSDGAKKLLRAIAGPKTA